MSFEAIGIGDLHLTDARGKGGLASYVPDSDAMVGSLVQQALDWAGNRGIQHIIFYGDLCEGTRMSEEARLTLLKIFKQDFRFYLILGNHDKFAEDSAAGHSLEFFAALELPNVRIFTEPTKAKIDGERLHFMPWPAQNFLPDFLNIAHVDVAGARSDSGRLFDSPTLSNSEYTAVIGHIHTQQKIRNTHYSGTLYQTNFGESADKYFHHIQGAKGDWEISKIKVNPIYRLHNVEVLTKKDLLSIPRSNKDFIKLILLDGCGVQPVDYQHLNVVKVKTAKSMEDLQASALEDLVDGSQVCISSEEFFNEWLRNSSVSKKLKSDATALRKRLLA